MSAVSPEELETLLEDAILLGDNAAVAVLFEERGVLVTERGSVLGRSHAAAALVQQDFCASVRSITVVRDVAVIVGDRTVSVSSRGPDQRWRLIAIVQSRS